MRELFDLVELLTEARGKENDEIGLYESLKDKPELLKRICKAIYEAKADYEQIKKFF